MNKTQNKIDVKSDSLKAIPIGGHGEIGKNSWIFEYKNEIIIVDFGILLPSIKQTGVDLILPNTQYLKENESKIKGLIITSPHDDDCGGVFYLLNKLNIPKIYAGNLAIKTIEKQPLKNTKLPPIEELTHRKEFTIGEFTIKAITNSSLTPNTFGLSIKTPAGNIIYTGSYKIEQMPLDSVLLDFYSYSQAGEDGTDVLISCSQDIETLGYSQPEKLVTKKFEEIFKEIKSRIVIVSGNHEIYKFQTIFNLANENKKKILLNGKHLIEKINTAIEAGYLNINKDIFITEKELKTTKEKDIVIIASGKYGNYLTALIDMADEKHEIKLTPDDTVVISADPIPGTVRILAHTIDQLFVQKIKVLGGRGSGLHVSGYATQEEAKFMLSVTKPKAFVPSHGEERQLVIHGAIAEDMGTNHNDIHLLKNGDVLEVRGGIARIANKIPGQSIYYNEVKGLDIDEVIMNERDILSKEGTITVALTIDKNKNIIAGPEIVAEACSFAKGKDWRAFCLGTSEVIKQTIKQAVEKEEKDLSDIKSIVRETVNKYVLELISKRPLINVSIQEIDLASIK